MKPSTLLLIGLLVCTTGSVAALELTAAQAAGKHLYREGISDSRAEVSARVGASDMIIPGSAVPCANCHGADGRGRPEGGVRPPDITWRRLSRAYGQLTANGRNHPAYDEAAIARAVTEGRDPAGNPLDPAMPRFVLSNADQLNLIAYLKRLEEDRDPGVEPDRLRLGTLLPAQGPMAELGDTMAAVLQGFVAMINDAGGIHGRKLELLIADPGPDRVSAEAALRGLLDNQQVFALVSPLAPALDGDMGRILEAAGVPLVGSLSLLGGRQNSRLIFEPLPGLDEQLQALARYAERTLSLSAQEALIVYPLDSPSSAQAQGLAEALRGQGWGQVRQLTYAEHKMDTVVTALAGARSVFYFGLAEDFARLATSLESAGLTPYLFAASTQVASDVLQVPAAFSRRLFLAYPFVPSDWTVAGKAALASVRRRSGLGGQHAVLQVAAYCSLLLLAEALKHAGRDVSRERLVSALEGLHDVETGLTPLLGFGPGQRLGMTGAHIVTVDLPEQRFELVGPNMKVNAAY